MKINGVAIWDNLNIQQDIDITEFAGLLAASILSLIIVASIKIMVFPGSFIGSLTVVSFAIALYNITDSISLLESEYKDSYRWLKMFCFIAVIITAFLFIACVITGV